MGALFVDQLQTQIKLTGRARTKRSLQEGLQEEPASRAGSIKGSQNSDSVPGPKVELNGSKSAFGVVAGGGCAVDGGKLLVLPVVLVLGRCAPSSSDGDDGRGRISCPWLRN